MDTNTDNITDRVHQGRGLVGSTDDADNTVAGWPDIAGEAIRSINHLTAGAIIAPPVVYDVLGSLQAVAYRLPQALTQLGAGLARSHDPHGIEDDNADPAENIARAIILLAKAAEHAKTLGEALEAAQAAIAGQNYTTSLG